MLFVVVSLNTDRSSANVPNSHERMLAAVEEAVTGVQPSSESRVEVSEQKRADMKKHAVSASSLVNTKMADAIPSSPLENILGSTENAAGEVNKTTGEQITGIDPKTGKRIDTGEMPSFIFPILLALGGTVVMVAVFTYMCCFKTEEKESKRAPTQSKQ